MAAAVPQGVATQAPDAQTAAPWQQQPAPGYGAPPAWPPAQQTPPQHAPPQYAPPAPVAQAAPPQYAPPQQYQPPQPPPQYAPQQSYAPPTPPPQQAYAAQPQHPQHAAPAPWAPTVTRSGPPTWVAAIGFAAILILVGGGIWFFVLRTPDSGSNAPAAKTADAPAAASTGAASGQAGANPYQNYVEVVGIRMITEDKKPVAKFVVVNHSSAEIDNLEANVKLSASTSRSEEDSVGSFSFRIPEIDGNSSKDMTAPLKTKLKMYELPDWQKTNVVVEITSPAQ